MTKTKRNIIIIVASVVLAIAIGALIFGILYIKNSDVLITETTEYNEDGTINWIAYRDPSGNLVKHTNYCYDVDSLTGAKTIYIDYYEGCNDDNDIEYKYEKTAYNYEGNPESYVMKELNKETNELEETKTVDYLYYSDGTIKRIIEKEFDAEGEHATKILYNEDGTVSSKTAYLNDEIISEE